MTIRLLKGDCLKVLPGLESESVDALVCDPPAGIAFMGKEWDRFGGRGNDVGQRDRFIAFLSAAMAEAAQKAAA